MTVPGNHSAAVVLPKEPFLEWAQAAFGDGQLPPGLPTQPRTYLIPKVSDDQEGRDYIQVECARVFTDMLAAWNPDPHTWPTNLESCTLFTAWFDVQIIPNVVALDTDTADG